MRWEDAWRTRRPPTLPLGFWLVVLGEIADQLVGVRAAETGHEVIARTCGVARICGAEVRGRHRVVADGDVDEHVSCLVQLRVERAEIPTGGPLRVGDDAREQRRGL